MAVVRVTETADGAAAADDDWWLAGDVVNARWMCASSRGRQVREPALMPRARQRFAVSSRRGVG